MNSDDKPSRIKGESQPRTPTQKAASVPQPLSDAQINRLMSEVRSDPYLHLIASLMLRSGLRKCEVERLGWSSVDFTNGTLRVGGPKEKGPRLVPIDAATLDAPIHLREYISEATNS